MTWNQAFTESSKQLKRMHLPCSSQDRGSLYQRTQSSEQSLPSATRLPTTRGSRGHQTTAITDEWASDTITSSQSYLI